MRWMACRIPGGFVPAPAGEPLNTSQTCGKHRAGMLQQCKDGLNIPVTAFKKGAKIMCWRLKMNKEPVTQPRNDGTLLVSG